MGFGLKAFLFTYIVNTYSSDQSTSPILFKFKQHLNNMRQLGPNGPVSKNIVKRDSTLRDKKCNDKIEL